MTIQVIISKKFFYLDEDYKVHRVSRKTGKDRIIIKMNAMDVKWTKKMSIFKHMRLESWIMIMTIQN